MPVLTKQQRLELLSLTEVFTQAQHLTRVAASNATQDTVLYRLLAVIATRALQTRGISVNNHQRSPSPNRHAILLESITAYLAEQEHNFNLFGPKPFYQVPGMTGEVSSWHRLAPGTVKDLLFDHTISLIPAKPITPGNALIRLLETQAYSVPGGQGLSPGPEQLTLHMIPLGDTLASTINLNLFTPEEFTPNHNDVDSPIWEKPAYTEADFSEPERQPAGTYEHLTWLSRSVQLIPTEQDDGSIGVTNMHFKKAFAYRSPPQAHPNPWASYVTTTKNPEQTFPVSHKSGRTPWLYHLQALGITTEHATTTGARVVRNTLELHRINPQLRTRLLITGNLVEARVIKTTVNEELPLTSPNGTPDALQAFVTQALTKAASVLTHIRYANHAAAYQMLAPNNKQRSGTAESEALNGIAALKGHLNNDDLFYDHLKPAFSRALQALPNGIAIAHRIWDHALSEATAAAETNTTTRLGNTPAAYAAISRTTWHYSQAHSSIKGETPNS